MFSRGRPYLAEIKVARKDKAKIQCNLIIIMHTNNHNNKLHFCDTTLIYYFVEQIAKR